MQVSYVFNEGLLLFYDMCGEVTRTGIGCGLPVYQQKILEATTEKQRDQRRLWLSFNGETQKLIRQQVKLLGDVTFTQTVGVVPYTEHMST